MIRLAKISGASTGFILALTVTCLFWPGVSLSQSSETSVGESFGAQLSEKTDWFKESFLEFEEDVAEAQAAGRRVMLYFYQEGCPYCARLVGENFVDPQIKTFMQQNFDSISLNIWGDREIVSVGGKSFSEKNFAQALKVQYTPTLIFLDESGRVALRLNGYYPPQDFRAAIDFVAQKREKELSYADYRLQQLASLKGQLIDEDFFIGESNLQSLLSDPDKPLAVFFESAGCAECQVMHERILGDATTRKLVTQASNVQLDIASTKKIITPQGKQTTAAQWARELGIDYTPSVVFFDSNANEVMRIAAFIKTFHFQSVYAYVLEKAYTQQPVFQRYISTRAEKIRESGYNTDIWGYESFHKPEALKAEEN